MTEAPRQTSTGLQENVAGLLCYVAGWVSGLVFLLLEDENRYVRFHAVQSIIVFGVITVAQIVLGWIPILNWVTTPIIGLLGFVLWVVLMVKAYQGKLYKVPWAGAYAERYSKVGKT